jgi:hypothetical protein
VRSGSRRVLRTESSGSVKVGEFRHGQIIRRYAAGAATDDPCAVHSTSAVCSAAAGECYVAAAVTDGSLATRRKNKRAFRQGRCQAVRVPGASRERR